MINEAQACPGPQGSHRHRTGITKVKGEEVEGEAQGLWEPWSAAR